MEKVISLHVFKLKNKKEIKREILRCDSLILIRLPQLKRKKNQKG